MAPLPGLLSSSPALASSPPTSVTRGNNTVPFSRRSSGGRSSGVSTPFSNSYASRTPVSAFSVPAVDTASTGKPPLKPTSAVPVRQVRGFDVQPTEDTMVASSYTSIKASPSQTSLLSRALSGDMLISPSLDHLFGSGSMPSLVSV